jgi:hypothetical protein
MSRLIELQSDAMKIEIRLTDQDRQEIADIITMQGRVSKGVADTVASAPNDDDLYDQMIASAERFREEVDRAIKIMERMLRRHR